MMCTDFLYDEPFLRTSVNGELRFI